MTDREIEQKAAELAGLEVSFQRAHAAYIEAADRFRRCSQERERVEAELTTLRAQRARLEADDELVAYCSSY